MKILIICYCYPPDPGPRAYRWSALAKDWAARGHEVHVISGRKLGAPAEEVLDGTHIYRVGGTVTENLRSWLEKRTHNKQPNHDPESSLSTFGVRELTGAAMWLKALHDMTWKNIYWPDSTCMWFFPARRKALSLLRSQVFDAIISTSTPYTGHLVGKAAKTQFADVYWMVDIGDPFSFDNLPWNNPRLHRRRNLRSESRILDKADSITVTVESCRQSYHDLFPHSVGKISVIPPLHSGGPSAAQSTGKGRKTKKLIFTGSLYRDIRNPAYFLALIVSLIKKFQNIEMHFFGRTNDCADCFAPYGNLIGKALHLHGLVDRDCATAAVASADILVNIGNSTVHQLPSKLVDYASTGKPILNLVRIDCDSSIEFLKTYPAALSITENPGGPSQDDIERVAGFINSAHHQSFDPSVFMRPFNIATISTSYLELLAKGRVTNNSA